MSLEEKRYNFGTPLREVDFFGFPRSGAHFLTYCLSGLLDVVSRLPEELQRNPEAASRQNELNALVLYSLKLREPGAPFQPIWLNALSNGVHGQPVAGGHQVIILIRDPIAASFSAWRARHLGFQVETAADLARHLNDYEKFYDTARDLLRTKAETTLLVRYEDLIETPETLESIVEFIDIKPKLSPAFVHWLTRFDNMVAPGKRNFYREGNNDAWKDSSDFLRLLMAAGPLRDFSRFGYYIDGSKNAGDLGVDADIFQRRLVTRIPGLPAKLRRG